MAQLEQQRREEDSLTIAKTVVILNTTADGSLGIDLVKDDISVVVQGGELMTQHNLEVGDRIYGLERRIYGLERELFEAVNTKWDLKRALGKKPYDLPFKLHFWRTDARGEITELTKNSQRTLAPIKCVGETLDGAELQMTKQWSSIHGRVFKHNLLNVKDRGNLAVQKRSLETIVSRYIGTQGLVKVFASHCTTDSSRGCYDNLQLFLQFQGNVKFFDPNVEFTKQDATKEAMRAAASQSDVVFACMSRGFFKSKWCFAEIEAAASAGKNIVPVYAGEEIPFVLMEKWTRGDYFAS